LLLVYALASKLDARALEGGLTSIELGGISAIVARVEQAPAVETDVLLAFDRVMRRLFEAAEAMLPVRFGTVLRDRALLAVHVEEARDALERALALVAGRAQMTLRLSGTPAFAPSQELARPSTGTEYLARKFEQHRRAQSVPELDPIKPLLDRLVVAERSERHEAPPWFASAYHLVERRRLDDYAVLVRALAPRLTGVRTKLSGPWPPYAFAPGVLS
jgi:hypothetical protein